MEQFTIVFIGTNGDCYHINARGPRERIETVCRTTAERMISELGEDYVMGDLTSDRIKIWKQTEAKGWVYNSRYINEYGFLRIVKTVPPVGVGGQMTEEARREISEKLARAVEKQKK